MVVYFDIKREQEIISIFDGMDEKHSIQRIVITGICSDFVLKFMSHINNYLTEKYSVKKVTSLDLGKKSSDNLQKEIPKELFDDPMSKWLKDIMPRLNLIVGETRLSNNTEEFLNYMIFLNTYLDQNLDSGNTLYLFDVYELFISKFYMRVPLKYIEVK